MPGLFCCLPLGGTPGEAFAEAFAAEVENAIASLHANPFGFSALIICPFFANEGFPELPSGFLDKVASAVRKAGGLVIADEVQPGLARRLDGLRQSLRIQLEALPSRAGKCSC